MHIYCVHWILNALCVPILPLDFSLFSSDSTRFISSKYLNRAFSWPKPMQDSKMHSERLWVHCVGATSIQKELFFRCVIFSTRHTAPRINSTITLNRVHWPTKNTQIEREKKKWEKYSQPNQINENTRFQIRIRMFTLHICFYPKWSNLERY